MEKVVGEQGLALHTAGAGEIWIDQSGFSRRQVEIRQLLSLEMALNIHEKVFTISKTNWLVGKKWNIWTILCFWTSVLAPRHGTSLVVRRVSPGRIIVALFWTKYTVPRQIKPGILTLTTSRGQRNLCTVFSFVNWEEKGGYRIVSLGHQRFDCRSYCGLSRRMQGDPQQHFPYKFTKFYENSICRINLPFNARGLKLGHLAVLMRSFHFCHSSSYSP